MISIIHNYFNIRARTGIVIIDSSVETNVIWEANMAGEESIMFLRLWDI